MFNVINHVLQSRGFTIYKNDNMENIYENKWNKQQRKDLSSRMDRQAIDVMCTEQSNISYYRCMKNKIRKDVMQPPVSTNRLEPHDLVSNMKILKEDRPQTYKKQNSSTLLPHMGEKNKHLEDERQDNKKMGGESKRRRERWWIGWDSWGGEDPDSAHLQEALTAREGKRSRVARSDT